MKVAAVTVRVLSVPAEAAYQAVAWRVTAHSHVVAEITTSDGVTGIGYDVLLQSEMVKPLAEATRALGSTLIGMNVLEVETAWARMAQAGISIGPGGLLHYAIAPLDIALWDAAGKSLGQPLYRLLGGYRDRLPAYASDGFWFSLTPEQLAGAARSSVAAGFNALKIRVGAESRPEAELRRVELVREAVGPDALIMIEVAERWDVQRALRTGRLLEPAGIHWLEDPIHHKNVAGLSLLASRLDVPIAAGENLYDVRDFVRLLEQKAVGVVLIDLARIGGITPWRRVAALAGAYDLRVCGHVLPEVHVHLLAAIPNGAMVEYSPRSAKLLTSMPVLEGGELIAPDAPGLGITLDREAVRRYSVE